MKSDTFLAGSPAGTIRRRSGTALTMLQADVALRLLLLPLAVVATLLFALPALSIAENTISGTVSLPSGRTATEDMYVSVFAQTEDYLVSTSAHIPAGESEGIYTLTVPPSGSTFLRVFYSYLGSEAYLQNGYYSLSGTQWQFDQATLLSGGVDPKDINLTLLTGNTISGTVSLPPGRTATEEMYVSVSAQTENYSVSVSATAYIPAGESEGIYTLTVPPDDSAPLRISYSYCCSEAYLRYGYFSLSGTQWQSDLATLLSGGADHNDIDLTLLTVNTISGTVSLPSGRTATENMYVSVYAWNPEDYSMPVSATAYIPAGESAGIYTLTVPPDGSASWQISYSYCCSEAFLQYGYYSLSGTQWQADQATPLSGGADHNGIDLTLLTVNTISGTVSLPSGRTATEDMPVSVYAQTEDYSVSVSTTAYIPAGESEGKYALALPPDGSASFRISYTYGGSEAYLQNGYYSLSGTQWQSDQATLLSGGSDHNDIDLTLLTGNTISGAVTLPPGRTATEDMYVSVSAQTEDYSVSVATTAYIPAGESAGIYALALPPDGSAPLRISYSYCCSEAYLQNGYYSLAGTQWQADQATFLSGGTDHKDIDLTLQTGNTISGALSLPSGRTATEDMQVSVYAQTEDYSVSVSTTAYIPAGKSEGVYTLKVPPSDNASLLISYTYWGSEPYFPEGYYCTTDTTWQREFASLLPGGTDHSDINLTLLIGNTISGTVFLPQDHAAPAGGFSITLLVTDATSLSGFSTGVLIQEGDSSASYEIHLPPASNDHFYIISYLVGESYLQSGYYSTSGTTWQSDLATLVSGGMDHDDINLTLLIANTISGTVSLPPEHTAPEGGIYVTLDAYNQNASVGGATTSAFIEAGQSSGTYTFLVPPDNNSAWQVSYWYWEGNEAYLHQGYYSSSGTQWQAEQATLLQGGTNHEKIDLTLLTGNTISGTISLPSGHTAPEGGMTVDVYAYDQNSSGTTFSKFVFIEAGKSSGTYTLTVPPETSASWRVYYSYYGTEAYLQSGYYSPAGTQWLYDQAVTLPGGTDHSDINLALLTGNTITGTVSLPPDRTAPEGGMSIGVSATNHYGSVAVDASAFIEAGQSSGTFSLIVPSDASTSWRVRYSYWGNGGYLTDGFYNIDGTQWQYDEATLLAGGVDHHAINLPLLIGNAITGTVSLPSERSAPEGGISVNVDTCVQNGPCVASTSVFIEAGQQTVAYTLTVPPASNVSWRVSYSYWGSEAYLHEGYYNLSGTQWQPEQATPLPSGADHYGIDLVLLTGSTIQGTVSLPQEHIAPEGGMYVRVDAFNVNDGIYTHSTTAFIDAGQSSGSYVLALPPDSKASWQIWYVYEGGAAYFQAGFHNTAGTRWQPDQASLLPGGMDHDGIDLTLLLANTISGTLALPPDHIAPEGGIYIEVFASNQGVGASSTSVFLEAGQASSTYSFAVPLDAAASWQVGYILWNSTSYLREGYYHPNGTEWQATSAGLLPGGSDHGGIDLTLLTGSTIQGTVSLPPEHIAPEGGMYVNVYAINLNNWDDQTGGPTYTTTAFLKAGQSSGTYALALPPDSNAAWRVYYFYDGSGSYFRSGHYGASGTEWRPDRATLLKGGTDYTGISLTLLTGNTISGTVSLPSGHTAPEGGIYISVDTLVQDGPGAASALVFIAAGQASGMYSLTVPNDGSAYWQVSYYLWGSLPYLHIGYYSSAGTQYQPDKSTLLPGGADYENVDLILLATNTISGTISLPEGLAAPNEELTVDVRASNQSGYTFRSSLAIPAGGNSTGYTLVVPDDNSTSWTIVDPKSWTVV